MPHRAIASFFGAGAPSGVTPEFVGQIYYDTTNNSAYISKSRMYGSGS